jgi:nicotinamide-nucleotide amidase
MNLEREKHFGDLRRPMMFLILLGAQAIVPQWVEGHTPMSAEDPDSVDYSIIVTGNELLTGVYADGHTLFLTKTLRPLGLRCVVSVSVDDQEADIRQALQFAAQRSQLIIVTGGLGPTETDITREVLSAFTGVTLREHPELLRRLERRFRTTRSQLRPNLRRQTRVPTEGSYLPNATGTAVGLVFEHDGTVIVALPGPPRELQPMVRDHLIPYLAEKFGVHMLGSSLTVRFVGVGQSRIDQAMRDHIKLPAQLMQTSQFASGRVDFSFSLPGNGTADQQELQKLRADLKRVLGDHIYAFDATTTLEEAVATQFAEHQQKIVLVEIGSGGAIAAGFCGAPDGRRVLAGALVAADLAQMQHLLQIPQGGQPAATDADPLEPLASAAMRLTQADVAVVVGPVVAEAGGDEKRFEVLIAQPGDKLVRRRWSWRGPSSAAQSARVTQLFDFLRTNHQPH